MARTSRRRDVFSYYRRNRHSACATIPNIQHRVINRAVDTTSSWDSSIISVAASRWANDKDDVATESMAYWSIHVLRRGRIRYSDLAGL